MATISQSFDSNLLALSKSNTVTFLLNLIISWKIHKKKRTHCSQLQWNKLVTECLHASYSLYTTSCGNAVYLFSINLFAIRPLRFACSPVRLCACLPAVLHVLVRAFLVAGHNHVATLSHRNAQHSFRARFKHIFDQKIQVTNTCTVLYFPPYLPQPIKIPHRVDKGLFCIYWLKFLLGWETTQKYKNVSWI